MKKLSIQSLITVFCVLIIGGFESVIYAHPKPKETSSKKVIVVGAGISGLIAGLRLQEMGLEVVVLEKDPQVGGRVYSEKLGGIYANLGAQYFFKSDNEYLNKYLDNADKFYPEGGKVAAIWQGKMVSSWNESFFLKLPIDRKALEDFDASIKKMQKLYSQFSTGREYIFDKYPNSQTWVDLDQQTAAELLSEYHPDVKNLYNMFLIPEGGAGVSETSALLLTGWYGQANGEAGSYLIRNGNQKLPQAIANDIKKMGGTIHLSKEVTSIENINNGVSVKCKDQSVYTADYVVVTTPASVTKWIVKGLSEEKQSALNAVKYGASMEVGLYLKNLPKSKRISSCIFHDEGINAYMDQSEKVLKNETVVSINIAGTEIQKLSDQEVVEKVTQTLQKIYPGFTMEKNIADYSVKRWKDGIVKYPPNFLNTYQEALRERSGNIFFGGDYTHNPALDGAAWSGIRAAEQVLKAVEQ
ncbi:flavin monoamine oxidase family protein [Flammeovirga agarivorans]|uniref:Tryptophan 2-monooxygenase n=1 Tax=Flammeovirga agarivorans TaxID=2726742 RepID=A0A7X8SP73_9BACT|nr:NAD(P)/FAD-dependent oxidoreductase [Flammeovirga agarivorans]NLR93777.1 FAD-dependent oxidoreductase [Flammeovirga agarivorans]